MSVLFDALNKAAHEYRRSAEPTLVPLPRAHRYKRRRRIMVIGGFLTAFAFGALATVMTRDLLGQAPTSLSSQGAAQTMASVAGSAVLPDKQASDDSQGIILSAEDLAATHPFVGAEVKALEGQVADLPVLTGRRSGLPPAEVSMNRTLDEPSGTGLLVFDEPEASPSVAAGPLDRAQAFVRSQDWTKALASYTRLLNRDPQNEAALAGKTYVLEQRGGARDLATLEKLAQRYPDNAEIQAALARLMARRGRTDAALVAWKKALSLDPANKDYRLGLAILHDRLGHAHEALMLYSEVPAPLPPEAESRVAFLAAQIDKSDMNMKNDALTDSGESEE